MQRSKNKEERMFEAFRRRKLEEEHVHVRNEYFVNLAKQTELRKRLRELRAKHLREEFEGTTKFSSGEFIAMSIDIPAELSALEAEFVKLEERRKTLRKKLDKISFVSSFVTEG